MQAFHNHSTTWALIGWSGSLHEQILEKINLLQKKKKKINITFWHKHLSLMWKCPFMEKSFKNILSDEKKS